MKFSPSKTEGFFITANLRFFYNSFILIQLPPLFISGLDFGICYLLSAIKILINKQNGNLDENFALNRYVRFAFMLCNFLQNKGKSQNETESD